MVSFVETLLPPTIAIRGCSASCTDFVNASISAAMRGPAHATFANRATPSVEACARCAVPNASFTNTSQSAAYLFANSASFFFSPLLQRQFSSITTSPGFTSTPSK